MRDREVESCCKSMRRKRKGDQKGATRWIMSVLPCPPNSYCYRLEKKECGSCELRKSTEKPLSTFSALHTGLWFAFHCLLLLESTLSHSVVSQHRTSQFIFLLQENEVSAAMWKGLIGSFEVILVTKLINNLMPIIHFNHGRWHLLPELQSTFTTAALLKGHNQLKACFVFL